MHIMDCNISMVFYFMYVSKFCNNGMISMLGLYNILSIKIPGTVRIPGMFPFCESMACSIYDIANTFNHGIENDIQQKNSENSKNFEKFSYKRKTENARKIS